MGLILCRSQSRDRPSPPTQAGQACPWPGKPLPTQECALQGTQAPSEGRGLQSSSAGRQPLLPSAAWPRDWAPAFGTL